MHTGNYLLLLYKEGDRGVTVYEVRLKPRRITSQARALPALPGEVREGSFSGISSSGSLAPS